MKIFSTLRNRLKKSMIKDQRGQGATEYILLLVVLVGIVMAFKDPLMNAIRGKAEQVSSDIEGFSADF